MKFDASRGLSRTEELARGGSAVHALHPTAKLLACLVYIVSLAGVGRFEPLALTPYVLFPAAVWVLSGLPFAPVARRLAVVMPFLLGMGLLCPVVGREPVPGHWLASGWLIGISIAVKGMLTASVALLYIHTTGAEGFARALRSLRVPKLLVMQMLMTLRYGGLLAEEAGRASLAYSLRAPRDKGIRLRVWGPFTGSLLLRSFDRAERIHDAMLIRGFDGSCAGGGIAGGRVTLRDGAFVAAVAAYSLTLRLINIPFLLGNMIV